jgi:hypothetical protein
LTLQDSSLLLWRLLIVLDYSSVAVGSELPHPTIQFGIGGRP